MLGGDRLDRVSELLRQEVSALFEREVEVPPGVLATVTRVKVSPDLEHATVWLSVHPSSRASEVFERLERVIGVLQQQLNRKLVMESVPRLRFIPDQGEDQAARIEQLLDGLDGNR
ncbi:MAG: 30S ribosome-binding factor RbfA [Candidatus Kerfeldbacteria bacterium]|nr:30S ribosome-binding factor RbfA [Candidatus Kerfeldbacteria bacterium]